MNISADVIIVGAGPVGLSLAIDLGQRGIDTVLIERKAGPMRLPKMERTNPRSMEIFRRLGVLEDIRARGLPSDKSMDIFLVSSLAQPPLAQIHYPSVDEARATIETVNDGTQPREAWQLVSQYTLEPILLEKLRSISSVRLLFNTKVEQLEQDAEGVSGSAVGEDGAALSLRCKYLVGCDGANSTVRQATGIEMEGKSDLGTLTNLFFRCDDLLEKYNVPQGRHWQFVTESANGGAGGSIVMQDDMRHFGYHTAAAPEGDPVEFLRRQTGLDISPTVEFIGQWEQNMLVAHQHRAGRVFLAGDANHVYIPAGGLGMNTGVVDAINLGWKLAGAIEGWAGPELLESYHAERNATARRTLGFVAHAVEGAIGMREGFENWMLEDNDAAREALDGYLARAVPMMRRVYDMIGADRGYRYASGVIAREDGPPPPDNAYAYVPSTYPGAHLPHLWLTPGLSTYDLIGPGYTLLNLGLPPEATHALQHAFDSLGAPLRIETIDSAEAREVYGEPLLLIRPDLHVAWRGAALPDDAGALAALVLGRQAQ